MDIVFRCDINGVEAIQFVVDDRSIMLKVSSDDRHSPYLSYTIDKSMEKQFKDFINFSQEQEKPYVSS